MIQTLDSADLLSIHEVLVRDFADSADAVSPPGVKSLHLLESALSRQHTGFGDKLKYSTPELSAATLCYGICCDHPFHNGNKRTALVATLCHLDKNGKTFLPDLTQDEMYDLMVRVAGHDLGAKSKNRDKSDEEVEILGRWLRSNTRRVERGERLISYRELRNVLQRHGFVLENLAANSIDVVKYVERSEWLGLRKTRERQRVMRMPWPKEGATVSKGVMRDVRRACNLAEDDGVDSAAFYSAKRQADYFVAKYKATLRRLAKT